MKTSYKAFAFAVLAALVVALAVVPADDASAATTVTGVEYEVDGGEAYIVVYTEAQPDENLNVTAMSTDGTVVFTGQTKSDAAFEENGRWLSLVTPNSAVDASTLYKIEGVTTSTVYFDQTPSGEPVKYTVSIAADIENGTVSADKIEAAEGETVTLTVAAADGYKVGTVSAGDIAVVADSTGAYSFTMPAQAVTVSATFEAVETPVEPEQVLEIVSVGYAAEDANAVINSALAAAGYEGAPVTDADPASVMYVVFTMTEAGTISVAVDGEKADNTIDFAAGVHAVYWAADSAPGETVEIVIADGDVSAKTTYTFESAPAVEEFDIVIADTENGVVYASAEKAAAGTEVALTAKPFDGYELDAFSVVLSSGQQVPVEDGVFIMPSEAVTVSATFKAAEPPVTYTVAFGEDIEVADSTGADVASGAKVAEGTVLTVTAVEKTGQVATITASVGEIAEDGTYTVTKDVEFAVTYVEKEYENASLSGSVKTSGTVFDATQLVTISADTTIVSGADITILGKLVVDEGVTLTIQAGAYIAVAGVADIKGNVVIEAADDDSVPGRLIAYDHYADEERTEFVSSGIVTVSGTVAVDGILCAMDDAEIVIAAGSSVEISETGAVVGTIEIEEDASLTVAGSFGCTYEGEYYYVTFLVAGTLVIDSDVPTTVGFGVLMTSASASFSIETIVFGDAVEKGVSADVEGGILVMDKSLNMVMIGVSLEKDGDAPADAEDYPVNATATVTGIAVSETSATVKDVTTYTMVLSGAVEADRYVDYAGVYRDTAPDYELSVSIGVLGLNAASIAFSEIGAGVELYVNGNATVDAALALGEGAVLESDAVLGVKAPVDATAKDSVVVNNGVLTVSGEGSVTAIAEIADQTSETYNGAFYTTEADKATVYHYVTVDAALNALQDGTTDKVSLYGKQTVTSDFVIGDKDVLALVKGASLIVGEKSGDDVTLTVAKGGRISLPATTGKLIAVNGTLFAEDFRDVSAIKDAIDSDVYSYALNDKGIQDNRSWAKWTNVYTALDTAASGDVVKLQKDVKLTKDAEIRDGVTLDADLYKVTVGNDTVLTVSGILKLTNEASALVLAPAVAKTETAAAKAAGAVAIAGYVQYVDDAQIPAGIAGAYYDVTSKGKTVGYLTSYANGAKDALKADGFAVAMKAGSDGKVALGDIALVGEKDRNVSISVYGDLTGSIALTYATVTIDSFKKIDATFAGKDGSIAVKAVTGLAGFAVSDLLYPADAEEQIEVLSFCGVLNDYVGEKGKEVDTSVAVDGNVYVLKLTAVSVDAFTVAGTLTVAADSIAEDLDVQGSLVVDSGADMTVTDLVVSGAVLVKDGVLDVTCCAVVTGSVDASAVDKNDDPVATFRVVELYIGTDGKQFTGADAAVSGNVDLTDFALAVPGAVVPESFVSADSAYVRTSYTAGNAAFLDAYGVTANSMEIADVLYSQENAEFLGWENEKGVVATTENVGAPGFTEVSAKVDYAIYSIQITTDGGINYITIGGKLLQNENGSNVFAISGLQYTSDLTLVFQGKAGYDTTGVKLYDTDGNATGVSLPSATERTTVEYQLIGSTPSASAGQSTVTIDTSGIIDAIDKNTEATENIRIEGGSSKDSSLTDILLIVLVILIVIMAALVAMRMMRS